MLDLKSLLTIKHYNGVTYTDYKVELGQVVSDTATITLDTTHYLYVGYYKPVNQLYFDIITPNTNDSAITIEYHNGTEYTAITKIDGTAKLERSGLIQWEELDDIESVEVDSVDMYWYRFSTDTLHSEAVYNFIGLIFSDDRDLQTQNPYILDTNMLMGESSHFKAHIAARDSIIQELIGKGYIKVDANNERQPITAWDLLDYNEVKQAAIYKALAIIYFNLSDDSEDKWMVKSEKYLGWYNVKMKIKFLSVDIDDDGIEDDGERSTDMKSIRMYR